MNEPAPNLLEARPDTPPALVELYFRMMEKHPDARQQTAQEVADALSAWLGATTVAGGRPRPEPPRRESLRRGTAATAPRSTAPSDSVGSPGSGSGGGSSPGSGSGVGSAPRSGDDIHALTPPPSSSGRSTARLPAAPPVAVARPTVHGPQPPLPGGIVIDTGSAKKPPAGGASRREKQSGAVPSARIGRRLADLPAPMWLAGAALLAAALGLGGWLWLRGPSNTSGQEADDEAEVEAADPKDRSATKSSAPKPAKPGASGPRKQDTPLKGKRADSRRGQKSAETEGPSGPSPLDELSKLVPAETGADASPKPAGDAAPATDQ